MLGAVLEGAAPSFVWGECLNCDSCDWNDGDDWEGERLRRRGVTLTSILSRRGTRRGPGRALRQAQGERSWGSGPGRAGFKPAPTERGEREPRPTPSSRLDSGFRRNDDGLDAVGAVYFLAGLVYVGDLGEGSDVGGGVAVYYEEVGELAGLDGAYLVVDPA